MSKMITRTITTHVYPVYAPDPVTRAPVKIDEIRSPKEMGIRSLLARCMEMGYTNAFTSTVPIATETLVYSMPIDVFMANATVYDPDAQNEEEPANSEAE